MQRLRSVRDSQRPRRHHEKHWSKKKHSGDNHWVSPKKYHFESELDPSKGSNVEFGNDIFLTMISRIASLQKVCMALISHSQGFLQLHGQAPKWGGISHNRRAAGLISAACVPAVIGGPESVWFLICSAHPDAEQAVEEH
ncbi:hypothetical protein NQZ68_002503 [Dissostichus eleginoides]|nr:hypothetical protein NQZ68_002503 [Dissostichus eleginoides]